MGANVVLIGCIGVFGPFPFSRGYTLEVCLHINMVPFFHNHGHIAWEVVFRKPIHCLVYHLAWLKSCLGEQFRVAWPKG